MSDHWEEIKAIFNSAMRKSRDERAEFLDRACPSDEVRHEVESLLASLDSAESFLERPAAGTDRRLREGETIGRYRVVREIGSGGMGEVYLARDEKLDRNVAIKVLNQKYRRDRSSVDRFMQEAKAASALNHPNILTIHEIGEIDDSHYIVSEFVDGQTLRDKLSEHTLSLNEALEIVIQIAAALSAAHSARIIHRDIKPENVIVRADGYVKVLDFGLAKLLHDQPSLVGADGATLRQSQTASGMILGTVSYMSPEQAKGEKVDQRTDIFSLGIVLYEMVSGKSPFAANSMTESLANLIHKEAQPLTAFVPTVPVELQQIVSKMLAKGKEERYQAVSDVIADLKALKHGGTPENSLHSGPQETMATQVLRPGTAEMEHQLRTTSAESPTRRRRWHIWLTLSFIAAGLAGLGFYKYRYSEVQPATSSPTIKVSRATNEGNVGTATISPDGKYIAYTTIEGADYNLWTKHLASNSRVRIAGLPAAVDVNAAAFTPDSSYVLYTVMESTSATYDLYQVPVLGGAPRKLVADVLTNVYYSPDGKQFCFSRFDPASGRSSLHTANADGSGEQQIAERTLPEVIGLYGASWAPDNSGLVTGIWDAAGKWRICSVRLSDGLATPLTSSDFNVIGMSAFIAGGHGMVFSAQQQASATTKLWYLTYPDGEPRPVTDDLTSYNFYSVAATADGSGILAVQEQNPSSVYIARKPYAVDARRFSERGGPNDGVWGISWDRNGDLFTVSQDENKSETWKVEAGSNTQVKIMDESAIDSLTVTPDGNFLVFISNRSGEWQIWRTDARGSDPRVLTASGISVSPGISVSADSRWVFYTGLDSVIRKVAIDGSEQTEVVKPGTLSMGPQISPDGKYLAVQVYDAKNGPGLTIYSLKGEEVDLYKKLELPKTYGPTLHWSADGRSIIYIVNSGRVSNLWQVSIDSGKSKQITNFTTERIRNFAYSLDGKQLAMSRGPVNSDAVLITGVK